MARLEAPRRDADQGFTQEAGVNQRRSVSVVAKEMCLGGEGARRPGLKLKARDRSSRIRKGPTLLHIGFTHYECLLTRAVPHSKAGNLWFLNR